jgi:ketosteroid isomerase-like protein
MTFLTSRALASLQNRFRICLALLIAASIPQVYADTAPEPQIRTAIANLWKGWETNNRALVEPIYHPQFTDVDFDGVRRTRAEVLAFLPVAAPKPEAGAEAEIKVSNIELVRHGDTVIASYIADDTRRRNGNVVSSLQFRANDTFVKLNGQWKLLAGQQTLLRTPDTAREAERAVLAAQTAFAKAALANDVEAAARTMHEDWIFTVPAGWSVNKQKFLTNMKDFWKPTMQRYETPRVTISGSTAIVSGRVFYEWKGGSAEEQFTDTYVNQYGKWLRIASHSSCMMGDCKK